MTEPAQTLDADYDDQSSLAGRATRTARVSTTMAGLAARLAGEKFLGLKIEHDDHARALTQALGNLKGPLMKVGQILSTIPEALPPEYASAFQQLQSQAPPMGWPFVRRRMKSELGPDWQARFASFEQDAAAAASLGQVHRAVLPDGRKVACKLQYPDMLSAIEADLNQLKIIFSVYEVYDKAISTKHIHAELSARLREELDYTLEARHARLYRHMLSATDGVHVAAVVDDYSTQRLLTSEWCDGAPILSYKDHDADTRNRLALNMFHAWYVPFYRFGVIHGDPHLGNYTVRDDLSLNLMDFGCVRVFPPHFVRGVIDLYRALLADDNALAVHAYETWGFTNLTNDQIETLNIWARFLYGPVMDDNVRPIGETKGGVYGRETAEKVHKKLREVGGVTVPREFVFMDRAALGLGSVFLHLRAEVNWYRLFQELIADFDEQTLTDRQDRTLAQFGIPKG